MSAHPEGSSVEATCPEDSEWNGHACIRTQVVVVVECPKGSEWQGSACMATSVHCPEGSSWEGARCVGEAEPLAYRDRASFFDTVWETSIPGSSIPTEYLLLRSDGEFEYAYDAPSDFQHDSGSDTWTFENGELIIIWTGGYGKERYDFTTPSATIFHGRKNSTSPNENGDCTIRRLR